MAKTFDSIKIYSGQKLDIDALFEDLIAFGYKRCQRPMEEGDFSRRGEVIEIFPVGFESPIRFELLHEKIEAIKSYDLTSGKNHLFGFPTDKNTNKR